MHRQDKSRFLFCGEISEIFFIMQHATSVFCATKFYSLYVVFCNTFEKILIVCKLIFKVDLKVGA